MIVGVQGPATQTAFRLLVSRTGWPSSWDPPSLCLLLPATQRWSATTFPCRRVFQSYCSSSAGSAEETPPVPVCHEVLTRISNPKRVRNGRRLVRGACKSEASNGFRSRCLNISKAGDVDTNDRNLGLHSFRHCLSKCPARNTVQIWRGMNGVRSEPQ